MKTSISQYGAGQGASSSRVSIVPAATVWEPSQDPHARGGEHVIRTLRPSGRTQGLVLGAGQRGSKEATLLPESWQDRALERSEALKTYVLGGLFGLCIVGVAVFQSGNEGSTDYSVSIGADTTGEPVSVSAR